MPRVSWVPPAAGSRGGEAVEFAAAHGKQLDEWQAAVLEGGCLVDSSGLWVPFEVGLDVARQNGKGEILETRELVGVLEWGERLVIHSAHEFRTSMEAFMRMEHFLEGSADLSSRVKKITRSHGEEGFTFLGGARIHYRTRTKGGGRGLSGDLVVFDEAMFLPEKAIGALLPTLSARPNPQAWYTGSAVDELIHDNGLVFTRLRARGHAGDDPRLAWFEWSAPFDRVEELDPEAGLRPEVWAQANPALGIRIAAEHVEAEWRSMDARTFAVERLGVGAWPDLDASQARITMEQWRALFEKGIMQDPVCLAFDVAPDRTRASIAAAGGRADGLWQIEIPDAKRGVSWVVDRIVELRDRNQPAKVICDGGGPAASLVPELERRGVMVETTNAGEYAQACGLFVDAVDERTFRHLGSEELASAVRGAATRTLGDAWAWSRRSSGVDITPLVAATLALSAAQTVGGAYVVDVAALMGVAS